MTGLKLHIPDELFAEAESSSFNGLYELETLKVGSDTYTFDKPLPYDLFISNTGNALLISGTVQGVGECQCARCLEPASVSVRGEVEEYILLSDSREAADDPDEEYEVLPEDHIIDLAPILSAALILDLPLIPLCKEDCEGLCSTCGANLNEGPCGCQAQPDDDFETNPFAVLKNYSFDNTDETSE